MSNRLFGSIAAVFEGFVDRVENHEAVAECLLREVSDSAAKLNVERQRLHAELDQLKQEEQRLYRVRDRWADRATRLADADSERALGCAAEVLKAERRLERIADQRAAHLELADQVQLDLEAVEERLATLRAKRSSLSARAARAKAMSASHEAGVHQSDALMRRWELAVTRDEYTSGSVYSRETSSLEAHFADEERREYLSETLQRLVQERKEGGKSDAS